MPVQALNEFSLKEQLLYLEARETIVKLGRNYNPRIWKAHFGLDLRLCSEIWDLIESYQGT